MKESRCGFVDMLSSFFVGFLIGGFAGLGLLYYILDEDTTGTQMLYCILGPALGVGVYCALFGAKGPSRATETYFDWVRFWRWWR